MLHSPTNRLTTVSETVPVHGFLDKGVGMNKMGEASFELAAVTRFPQDRKFNGRALCELNADADAGKSSRVPRCPVQVFNKCIV